jgi:Cu2+-exporting ATPase
VQSLETLAQVNAVVFDKTGTLTSDHMDLQALFTPQGDVAVQDLHRPDVQALLRMASSMAQHSSHPYSRAVVQLHSGLNLLSLSDVQEHVGQGLSARLVGADGVVQEWRMGSLAFCQAWHGRCGVPVKAMGAQVHLCDANGWLASWVFQETLRDDALQTVQQLQAMGMAVHVLSGDKEVAVERVGYRLNLPLRQVQASCSPELKLQQVKALQAQGFKVAMVGDGFNDMPVLAGAHVSFAFGQAVPLAQARADVVVQGTHLLAVAHTLALARRTQKVVRHNLMWAAIYNAVCVPLAFMGYLPPWLAGLGMALSSLWVVLYSLQLAVPMRVQASSQQVV